VNIVVVVKVTPPAETKMLSNFAGHTSYAIAHLLYDFRKWSNSFAILHASAVLECDSEQLVTTR
jgi:hypothetical protein